MLAKPKTWTEEVHILRQAVRGARELEYDTLSVSTDLLAHLLEAYRNAQEWEGIDAQASPTGLQTADPPRQWYNDATGSWEER